MLVRQAFFQFVEDALGVCSQLPALNERLSRFYALLAVPRALGGTHKTVDRDVPKGIIVIAAYAERDQIAISGDSIYLLRSDGAGCCPREGQIVKDRCDAPVPKRLDVVMSPIVVTPVALDGFHVIVVTRAIPGREGIPQQGHHSNLSIVGWWIRADRVRTHEVDTQSECHGQQ